MQRVDRLVLTQRSSERNRSSGNSQTSQTFRERKVVENPKSLGVSINTGGEDKHTLLSNSGLS